MTSNIHSDRFGALVEQGSIVIFPDTSRPGYYRVKAGFVDSVNSSGWARIRVPNDPSVHPALIAQASQLVTLNAKKSSEFTETGAEHLHADVFGTPLTVDGLVYVCDEIRFAAVIGRVTKLRVDNLKGLVDVTYLDGEMVRMSHTKLCVMKSGLPEKLPAEWENSLVGFGARLSPQASFSR